MEDKIDNLGQKFDIFITEQRDLSKQLTAAIQKLATQGQQSATSSQNAQQSGTTSSQGQQSSATQGQASTSDDGGNPGASTPGAAEVDPQLEFTTIRDSKGYKT